MRLSTSLPRAECLCAVPQGHPAAVAYTLLAAILDENGGGGPHNTIRLSARLAEAAAARANPATALGYWLLFGPLVDLGADARGVAQVALAERIFLDLDAQEN